jgi:cytochrome c-type biogenesis protein
MAGLPTFLAAFAAGLFSFLSPCVLPLIPSYLAMLAGTSVTALRDGEAPARRRIFARSLAFVAGFSTVFILLGLLLSKATSMIGGTSRKLALVAGIVVVLLGLNVAFDFLKILNFEKRIRIEKRPKGAASAFLFGAAFGAGWSPCVGPMLASILLLAGRGSTAVAATLLGVYSLGLGLPFLAAGFFFGRLEGIMTFLKRRMREVKLLSGTLLVVIGLSMIAGDFRELSGYFARGGYALEAFSVSAPLAAKGIAVAVYLLLALLITIWASKGKTSAKKRKRMIAALGFAALAILEALGVMRSLSSIASWLLFQGL